MATIFACGAVGVNAADFTRQRAGSGLAYRPSIQVELRESLSSENSQPADSLLAGFYAARDFAPVWIGSFEAERMAEEVRAALREAPRNGLSSADYASPTLRRELTSRNGREAVEYEIALTKSLLRYAADLRIGRIRPKDVYKDVDLPTVDFDSAAELTAALERHSIRTFLAELVPPHPEYARLAEAMEKYHGIAEAGGWPKLEAGEFALDGNEPRLKALKTRLDFEDETLAAVLNPTADELRDAVKRFQQRHGLDADGRVGPGTLAALNVPASYRADQIAANLERWRWLPQKFERRFIRVNVPDQSVDFVRDGEVVLSSKVIIGRKNSATPILKTMIWSIVANPPWDIPDDIAAYQILPQLKKNPNYLASQNMVLVNGPPGDPQGRRIDWRRLPPGQLPYHVVQIPGPSSVLGLLMLDSPNDFDVYLHDTPAKQYFASNDREISNGCVRVEQIFPLASLVLADDPEKGLARLKETIAKGETSSIPLDDPVPLYMLYWTAAAGSDGSVEFRPDRYNRDQPLMAALGRIGKAPARQEARAAALQ